MPDTSDLARIQAWRRFFQQAGDAVFPVELCLHVINPCVTFHRLLYGLIYAPPIL